jgi:hypothetical protein
MRKLAISLVALMVLAGLSIGSYAQENPLGKAVAPLFSDRQKVKQASYTAWMTARDEGPRASMEKSFAHLQKATASADIIPAQAAPDVFAAWWYNVAAQYWSEIAAKKPGGEGFAKAIEGIKMARQDLEKALGWDAGMANRALREAYRIIQGYK